MWVSWNDTRRYPREIEGSLSWVSLSLQQTVESADIEPGFQGVKRLPTDDRLSTSRLKRRRRALKITQRSMVEKRSYGSIWQSVFVSVRLRPYVSHTTEDFTPFERNKDIIPSVVVSFTHHEYITIKMSISMSLHVQIRVINGAYGNRTLSIIRYGLWVKLSSLRKGVAPSPTPQCSSYWKGSLQVPLDKSRQLCLLLQINFSKNISWNTVKPCLKHRFRLDYQI